jgi:hypothetical protein
MSTWFIAAGIVLASPVVALFLSGVGWIVRSRYDELQRLEESLNDDRRRIYAQILEPYIVLFAGLNDPSAQAKVLKMMLSLEYRRTAFELALFASDDVVRAYNELMQFFYRASGPGQYDTKDAMRHWGVLLWEIRRSMGNRKTKLSEWDMLRWLIKDIDQWTK